MRVYPRACGGTDLVIQPLGDDTGLSPRVRGNRRRTGRTLPLTGSIPARAGEPLRRSPSPTQRWVYPRACGGTVMVAGSWTRSPGLSPRVRGNLTPAVSRMDLPRSIPARAGEPLQHRGAGGDAGVYPRACGGTGLLQPTGQDADGLSPRVRGNPQLDVRQVLVDRSIPARAGEPRHADHPLEVDRVYPRACGGTSISTARTVRPPGLSPRVRGNLERAVDLLQPFGSIPARAGEPGCWGRNRSLATVYPRACGGTGTRPPTIPPPSGLSPRVRGNPAPRPVRPGCDGSIPARAGEPGPDLGPHRRGEVYPRACGGTGVGRTIINHYHGLSPRVRGNL